ncbi:MAG: dephospho-CoA kinase [Balneolales bacterium]|nr:dephospho-CoA kinase [Balneolales bacterium]
MKILGVTGTIGSGKSLFCTYLREFGATVIDADKLAKSIMVDDDQVRKQISEAFGQEAYHSDGSLYRSFLAEEAFAKGRSEELNKIVHPAVNSASMKLAEIARREGKPLFVKEAALLLHNGRGAEYDYIVWVQSDLSSRIERVQQRDGIDVNQVLSRNEKQKQLSEVASLIDEIVINDGTKEQLKKKAQIVFDRLVSVE